MELFPARCTPDSKAQIAPAGTKAWNARVWLVKRGGLVGIRRVEGAKGKKWTAIFILCLKLIAGKFSSFTLYSECSFIARRADVFFHQTQTVVGGKGLVLISVFRQAVTCFSRRLPRKFNSHCGHRDLPRRYFLEALPNDEQPRIHCSDNVIVNPRILKTRIG